ncbi:Uncharacterized protein HDU88_003245 [Geranomyces variabilis]|nr:Uncharacterized protein HDU88_003245 [Geranomyces variabilis]
MSQWELCNLVPWDSAEQPDVVLPLRLPPVKPWKFPYVVPMVKTPVNWTEIRRSMGEKLWGQLCTMASNKLDEVDELMFIEGRLPAAWSLVEEPSRPPRLFGEKLSSATLAKITDGRDYDDLGRAAYPGDLHRISVEKVPGNKGVVQACIRIGRVVMSVANAFDDVISSGKNVVIAGRPGRGGRDPAMVVMRGIRCFTPRVLVVDELSTAKEAEQAIQARRSNVSLVATIHGDLKEFTANKNLQELAGKIRESTVLDVKAASASFGWQKSFRQREQPSTFDVMIEIVRRNHWIIYHDVDAAIDACLGMTSVRVEHRRIDEDGVLIHWFEALSFAPPAPKSSKAAQEDDDESERMTATTRRTFRRIEGVECGEQTSEQDLYLLGDCEGTPRPPAVIWLAVAKN